MTRGPNRVRRDGGRALDEGLRDARTTSTTASNRSAYFDTRPRAGWHPARPTLSGSQAGKLTTVL